MYFRPCIDIHDGKVKQIIGKSLTDSSDSFSHGADENFVSRHHAAYYAGLYKNDGLRGGHIILLNPAGSPYYHDDVREAIYALDTYPYGLQIGGGITDENASYFLEHGASHVIVTSYVFRNGLIDFERLKHLTALIGRSHLVLDLSCRKKDGVYYVVTDRWQKFTSTPVTPETLLTLSGYCSEFLIHAVDVEGCVNGIETDLIRMLSSFNQVPLTYAGGISSYEDIETIGRLGQNHFDFTVGSALDLFGGRLSYTHLSRKYGR